LLLPFVSGVKGPRAGNAGDAASTRNRFARPGMEKKKPRAGVARGLGNERERIAYFLASAIAAWAAARRATGTRYGEQLT